MKANAAIVLSFVVLFAGWSTWMVVGRVTLYVASSDARIEVEQLPVAVQAPVDGQITFADLRLGRTVRQGDTILKLDAQSFVLQRESIDVAIRSAEASLEALRSELGAEQSARAEVNAVSARASAAASARVALDEKTLQFRQKEMEVVERLRGASAASGLDALHIEAGTETQRAQLAATAAQAALEARTGSMSLRDRDVKLATVRYSITQVEAERAKLKAQRDTVAYEISRRTIAAPASGTLADILPLAPGGTITAQQRIATILPAGTVRVVAFFAPQESIGRLSAGQRAILRVDNFPWTQFGTVGAVVDHVGGEPRDGKIRVELHIGNPNPSIPLEHGLTGRCEVEVERASPLVLLLRSAGQWQAPDVAVSQTVSAARGSTGP